MNDMHRWVAIVVAPLLLAGCDGVGGGTNADASASGSSPLAGARIGGPFSLTDQNGRAVTDRTFAGQYRIMYFGYTSCPDVCPTDAQNIGQGLRLFEQADAARAARVTPIFVSVDPQRDTPAVLRQFVGAFHPRMVGLTGTPQAIQALARDYAVHYSIEPAPGQLATAGDRQGPNSGNSTAGTANGGAYLVSHTRVAYLMGPDGRPIALIPEDQGPQAVAAALTQWVQ